MNSIHFASFTDKQWAEHYHRCATQATNPQETIDYLKKSWLYYRRTNSAAILEVQHLLGLSYLENNQPTKAKLCFEHGYSLTYRLLGPFHKYTTRFHALMAYAYAQLENKAFAELILSRYLKLYADGRADNSEFNDVLLMYFDLCLKIGRESAKKSFYRQSIHYFDKAKAVLPMVYAGNKNKREKFRLALQQAREVVSDFVTT